MNNKALTLSIVIPVYNEELYLKACLDSIAAQDVKPLEVIVVDNNSTDKSLEIAQRYEFVTLLSEDKQGQVFAQAKGFDFSTATILGRIDADSVLPTNWTEKVVHYFQEHSECVALTGDPDPYDVVLRRLSLAAFHFYHSVVARIISGRTMLWGANCALRADAWQKIKKDMVYRRDIWEDYDMAFLLNELCRV